MHSILTRQPPKPEEKVWEIRDLNGKVRDTRSTYYGALMVGYLKIGCGGFSVEERKP